MNDLNLFTEPPGGHHPGGRPGRRAQRAATRAQRRRRVNSRAAVMFALAFLVAIVGGGGLFGYVKLHDIMVPPDYEGQGTGSVVAEIKQGDTVGQMGVRLESLQVVKSSRAFVKEAGKDPKAATIQPGFYEMRRHMASKAALALLLDPKARAGNQITIPEGLRVSQIIDRLSKKTGIPLRQYQAALKSPKALGLPPYAKGKVEGYLYPGLYHFDPKGTATQHLREMVDRFKDAAASMDLENRARTVHLTPTQVIAMASIVQAESGSLADMPKISRVIYNRLQKNMQLQMDSTVMYALNKFGISATSQELNVNSKYNTYRNFGLPPGAISAPGEKAIEAVFAPAEGPWLYFVTTDPGKGITEFAVTQAAHDKLVAKLNAYMKTNGGN